MIEVNLPGVSQWPNCQNCISSVLNLLFNSNANPVSGVFLDIFLVMLTVKFVWNWVRMTATALAIALNAKYNTGINIDISEVHQNLMANKSLFKLS